MQEAGGLASLKASDIKGHWKEKCCVPQGG